MDKLEIYTIVFSDASQYIQKLYHCYNGVIYDSIYFYLTINKSHYMHLNIYIYIS